MRARLLALLLACALLTGCAAAEGENLTAVFYDVGKADAMLLYADGAAILIDTGLNKSGKQIVADLSARGVERLDLLIITHFDNDHVGGADSVLAGIPVDRVLEPVYEKESKQVAQYREALDAAGLTAEGLTENLSLEIGPLRLEIDVANEAFYGEDEENDFSLVVRLTHGSVRFLFAGDVENPRLEELLNEGDLKSDVLKVPYHGKYERMNAPFLAAISPKIAVITSSDKEPEDERTLQTLQEIGAKILLTRHGTVEIVSDGTNVEEPPR